MSDPQPLPNVTVTFPGGRTQQVTFPATWLAPADCADPAPGHSKPQSPDLEKAIRASLHLGEAYSDVPGRDPHPVMRPRPRARRQP